MISKCVKETSWSSVNFQSKESFLPDEFHQQYPKENIADWRVFDVFGYPISILWSHPLNGWVWAKSGDT